MEEEQLVGAEYCPVLEDLLAVSDYVVVLVNLTKESTHLIGRKQLSAMKSTATLINVSRGRCPHVFIYFFYLSKHYRCDAMWQPPLTTKQRHRDGIVICCHDVTWYHVTDAFIFLLPAWIFNLEGR